MPRAVMQEIVQVVEKAEIKTLDITGGAPELHPYLRSFIDKLYRTGLDIILRTNLVALAKPEQDGLLCKPKLSAEKLKCIFQEAVISS